MKKLLFLPLFVFVGLKTFAQNAIKTEKVSEWSVYIKGANFEGVIFSKDYKSELSKGSKLIAFSPEPNEIVLVEEMLDKNLDSVKNSDQNQMIHKNINKYYRQYWGYIDKNGDKIIFVNALHKLSNATKGKGWLRDVILVYDGGQRYWQIKINLAKQILFDFRVNGVG